MGTADELKKLHDLMQSGALSPGEFEAAKAKLLGRVGEAPDGSALAINRLRLSDNDRWIAGVCGGVAAVTGVDSWIWRLVFVLGLFAGGVTLMLYLVLWIFVPRGGD